MVNDWFSLIFIITACLSAFYLVASLIFLYLDYNTQGIDRMSLEALYPVAFILVILEYLIPIAVIFLACIHFLNVDFHFVSPFSITVK